MKNILNIFKLSKKKYSTSILTEHSQEDEGTDISFIQQSIEELQDIQTENKPFRLSGLLHRLTEKVASLLKEQDYTIYYDVDKEVGRYIIGDATYIEKVLEIVVRDALSLNMGYEIILKISKYKNTFLRFEVINEKGIISKDLYRQYTDLVQLDPTQSKQLNYYIKAKLIVEAMHGRLVLKSSKRGGTQYIFEIPYAEDKNGRSHQKELKKYLTGKKSLFIGRNEYDTKRAQYIFETYGIHIENLKLDDFENKRPNLDKYDMAIMRSKDLSYKHISFFKNIFKEEKSDFKIIIVHELFEEKEKIEISKSIAHAELYNPTVIGDVEEVLYKLFILQSKSVKGINNIEIFDTKEFTIKGDISFSKNDLLDYRGAHIAIVEDSHIDKKILQNILMKEGITLFCANNGLEMIELLKSEEIDIIFTDIKMPMMDGLLMTKKIRTMKKYKAIPIISISSMVYPHEQKKMELAGINAAIHKPIVEEDLYAALKKFLIMNDKIIMREKSKNKLHFSFNKEVLDTEKGTVIAKSNMVYLEKLLKTMDNLKMTKGDFEDMINNKEYIALGRYARDTLSLYEDIYAPNMIKMFKDLNYFLLQGQKKYILDYIAIYDKHWKALEEEVEKYIKSIDALI